MSSLRNRKNTQYYPQSVNHYDSEWETSTEETPLMNKSFLTTSTITSRSVDLEICSHRRQTQQTSLVPVTYSPSLEQLLEFLNLWFQELLKNVYNNVSCMINTKRTFNVTLSEEQLQRMKTFNQQLQIPFDSENQVHENLLKQLWDLSFPGLPLQTRKGKHWGELGFQGTDPATDFRGAGIFGLKNLVYFARVYPREYHRILKEQKQREENQTFSSFPFAIAGLNICYFLYSWISSPLKITSNSTPKQFQFSSKSTQLVVCSLFPETDIRNKSVSFVGLNEFEEEDDEESLIGFHELFCYSFTVFCDQWKEKNGTYMQFSQIINSTQSHIDNFISSQTNFSIDILKKINLSKL